MNKQEIDKIATQIETLTNMLTIHGLSDRQIVAIHAGISALGKQIPKKVIRVNIPPKWGGKIIKCPSCDSKNIGTKFCLDCGQAIDWSGDDE